MKIKNNWKKFPITEKIIIILFLLGLFFLISGMIMLLTIKVNGIFNGFNLIYYTGVIDSLSYYEPNNLVNLIFLKIGIIFTIFLVQLFSGTSIIWFIINRCFF